MRVSILAEVVIKEGWAVKESGQVVLGQTNWRRRLFRLVRIYRQQNTDVVVIWAYYRYRSHKTLAELIFNLPAIGIKLLAIGACDRPHKILNLSSFWLLFNCLNKKNKTNFFRSLKVLGQWNTIFKISA